jgi:hypothetical protein
MHIHAIMSFQFKNNVGIALMMKEISRKNTSVKNYTL